MWIANDWQDYELLDCGGGEKLERWDKQFLVRPDPQAIWETPHYNYVGDSILGYKSHMGAGSITSNVKSDKTLVTVRNGEERIETGRKKFGAILGDNVEVGCNSVLNPGTVLGRRASVYPTSCVRGCVPEDHIFKDKDHIVKRT